MSGKPLYVASCGTDSYSCSTESIQHHLFNQSQYTKSLIIQSEIMLLKIHAYGMLPSYTMVWTVHCNYIPYHTVLTQMHILFLVIYNKFQFLCTLVQGSLTRSNQFSQEFSFSRSSGLETRNSEVALLGHYTKKIHSMSVLNSRC